MRWRTSTWNSKNPKTTQSIRASPGPAARKMYKVIAKANLYISGRAAMEARRLSKCEYGTERQQNLLKMPLALCGTGHSKREGGCLAVDWTAGADLTTGFWVLGRLVPLLLLSSWQQLHFTDLRSGALVACVASY